MEKFSLWQTTLADISRFADWTGILALFITIIGFGITAYGFYVTTRNAKAFNHELKQEVEKVINDLRRTDSLIDFTLLINIMNNVKVLLRDGELNLLPPRYSEIRNKLKTVSNLAVISESDRKVIHSAIKQFRIFETAIETHIAEKTSVNVPKFNSAVNRHIDQIQDILEKIRAHRGG